MGIDLFFGFFILCGLYPIKTLPTKYLDPESIFVDSNYLVCVLNNKAYLTGESRFLEKYKNGVVKIGIVNHMNSYGSIIISDFSLRVLTKEEWDKISLLISERPDGVDENEIKNNVTKGNRDKP